MLPCVDSPSEKTSDEAFERLMEERERIDRHMRELAQARQALDVIIDINRAHRKLKAGVSPL